MEKTGQKLTKVKGNLKDIIEQLDLKAPKVEQIDYNIYDQVMQACDFTKTKNALESLKMFYEQLWTHVVFPLQDDLHLYQRENGRLILEADENRRLAEKYDKENDTLREQLQEKSSGQA